MPRNERGLGAIENQSYRNLFAGAKGFINGFLTFQKRDLPEE